VSEPEQVYGLPRPEDPEPGPKLPPTTIAALVGLLMAALCLVVVGLGFAFDVWSDDEDEPDEAAAVVDSPSTETGAAAPEPAFAGAEQVPSASADRAPVVTAREAHAGAELVPTAPVDSGGGQAGDAGDGGGGGGGTHGDGDGAATRGGGPRVDVALRPIHYDHVEVRIGGSVFRIDGNKTVKIRPGAYQVELRKTADASWKPAGRISVELGTRYRLKLFDPPLTKIEVIE